MDSDLQGEVLRIAAKIINHRAVLFRNDERLKHAIVESKQLSLGIFRLLDLICPMNSIK
jgi:hypothetical protein